MNRGRGRPPPLIGGPGSLPGKIMKLRFDKVHAVYFEQSYSFVLLLTKSNFTGSLGPCS